MIDLVQDTRRALVVAPHPDDEVLGCGGTMARMVDAGAEVEVVIVTRGRAPRFAESFVDQVRAEIHDAHARLGVGRTHFLDLPAAELDGVPHADLNSALADVIHAVVPDTVFLPFVGDIHLDHQLIFLAGMVAARPNGAHAPRRLLAYETQSETNWNAPYISPGFVPNLFVDIEATLSRKLDAMCAYASQLREFPDERSLDALSALARLRGATVHRRAAEAFLLLRAVV